ncbi:MAG: hypothetical protein KAX31_07560, partial [Thermoplasmata archaeon]|nr:hypothetical protein [Thermoplasmata archaeon]
GEAPEIRVGFILETPTGFWMSSFYDGPARFRHVFLPWGSFTWVSLPEPDLDPHHHGFNEPDKSRIDGFYWTVHTPGVRRVDYIYAPVGGDLLAVFTIRKSASANLSAGFDIRHSDLTNLFAEFISQQAGFAELPAEFESGQDRVNLPGQFDVGQGSEDLLCGFVAGVFFEDLFAELFIYEREFEDFEDATLVDHYQHSAGTGFRNAIFPHTGTWSWRTPQNSNDTFDLSDGQPLIAVKIEAWSRYGNGTLRFDLLDADLNIIETLTWGWYGTYRLRTTEYMGPIRYLKITCPAGVNSGVWTDDITIHWTTQTPTTRNLKAGFIVNHP